MNFTNDILAEIFTFLPIEGFYKRIPFICKQWNFVVTEKIFLQTFLREQKIPKDFILKYYNEICKPLELTQIFILWKEQHSIYFYDLVMQKRDFSHYKFIDWRMDVIENSFKKEPYSTLACIPVNNSKALFVNLYINDEIYENLKEKFTFKDHESLFSNFVQVQGKISNVKLTETVYVDIQVENIEYVVNIEKKVSKLPKHGLNPLETPFELFYSRYKGKIIQWEDYIDEVISSNSIHLIEPNVTIYHHSKENFIEGDLIQFKGRIGTLMSIFCDEVSIKKPISFFTSIQKELITLGFSSGFFYLFYKYYKNRSPLVYTSQFILCFISLLTLQYNLLYDHSAWTKGIIDTLLFYTVYRYWGKWSIKGTSIFMMIISFIVNTHSILQILKKTSRIKWMKN